MFRPRDAEAIRMAPASQTLHRPWLVRALIVFGLALTVAATLHAFGVAGSGKDDAFLPDAYFLAGIIGMVLCAWRAIRVRQDRASWGLIAFGFSLLGIGNLMYLALYGSATAPVPSPVDVPWLAVYLPLIAALALRVHAAGGVRGVAILDVLIAIGALGSISAAFAVDAILAGWTSSTAQLATTLAYVVGDLVLITLVVQLAAANGWRLGRATGLMAACFACWAVADTAHGVAVVHGTYAPGSIIDVGWIGPLILLGAVAWMRPDAPTVRQTPGLPALVVPAGFAVVALAMLVNATTEDFSGLAVALAAGSLVCVIARFVLTFRSYLVVLRRHRVRGDDRCADRPGQPPRAGRRPRAGRGQRPRTRSCCSSTSTASRATTTRSATRPATRCWSASAAALRDAVGALGTTYRMGGDEFCVLLGPGAGERAVSAACAALSERGEGFAISASHGRAAIPAEAASMAEALRIADQRMYRDKRSARGPAGEQATHALLRVLTERHPDMGDHSQGVADLAEAVARELGVSDATAREVRSAAALHDIGKAAIPDAILSSPARWTTASGRSCAATRSSASGSSPARTR